MGVAGALAKFGAKAAAKVGGGAIAGSVVPGAGTGIGGLIGIGSLMFDVIPLIQDLAKSGTDPAKLDAIKKARDGMAEKLVQSKGIPMDQALAEVNEQLKPMIDEAAQGSGGASAGEIAADGIGLAGGLFLAKKAGFLGRGKKAVGAAAETVAKDAAPVEAAAAKTVEPMAAASAAAPEPMDSDLVNQLVAARLRELSPEIPGGGGLDMANAAMGLGRGTKGMNQRRR